MKKVIFAIIAITSVILLTSCAMFNTKGRAAKAEEKGREKIASVDSRINANTSDKLDAIASLAYGTDYALSKVPEPSREIEVARDINKRVESLAGSPTLDQMKEMQDTIDKLTSLLVAERNDGKQKLSEKDKIIINLQNETKALNAAKESEIHKYMQIAQDAAASADAYKVELDKMNKWLGLGAVFYGLKKFIISSMWILGIGGILFFILRIASASNPVCGAIFGIIEQIVAWGINAIKVVFPKALQFAGQISSEVHSAMTSILWKIVDNAQNLKQLEQKTGHDVTLKELFVELDKSLDSKEKEAIETIKKRLGYI